MGTFVFVSMGIRIIRTSPKAPHYFAVETMNPSFSLTKALKKEKKEKFNP